MRLVRAAGAVVLVLAVGAARVAWAAQPPATAKTTRLYLIGDAGAPAPDDPVLRALHAELSGDPARSVAVFLGDNAYPKGLPEPGSAGYGEARRRLDAQVEAVRASGARAIFLPGNHDWARGSRRDGLAAIVRQTRHLSGQGHLVTMLPGNGCPGPAVEDVGERLRIVVLDTQWWLHDPAARPSYPTSSCPQDSEAEVTAGLRSAIAGAAGRLVAVVAHHPLESGGPHGGRFGLRDHLFPAWEKGVWIPLPGLGSIYPLYRAAGGPRQDLASRPYRHLRRSLAAVFAESPPLLYATGHEHNLQVIRRPGLPWLLVSGSGAFRHTSRVVKIAGALYAEEESGFMRVEVSAEGGVELTVLTVDRSAHVGVAFRRALH
jgi:hypothetical protein